MRVRLTDSLYFKSYRFVTQVHAVSDLVKRRRIRIRLAPEVCVPYVPPAPCPDTVGQHYAFIGRKVSVRRNLQKQPYYCNVLLLRDPQFEAEYELVERLYGNPGSDTIRFTAFDHYGFPKFAEYRHVLLFVSRYCSGLIHQKYQFFDVYRTTDGRWAAPYSSYDYERRDNDSSIRPVPISFAEPVVVDVSGGDSATIAKEYPAPYYRIENGKAIALYGNYIPELIEIKQRTVFNNRRIRFR
ncbi:hypothetical protein GCM10023184_15380 [Flaviaesturariibacter amylovorans]|uniref:Uncharacterized protein n=2 Tax=Flaviaesturariibacter amylovorans TaxID=1084520 RepID=A0ABP8GLT5_9BACT